MMHARLMNGEVLSQADAAAFMREVMAGEMSGVRMAAALAALRVRGETPGEIAGFAQAMRENAVRVNVRPREVLLDVVGTGGDGAHTFNISTTTAFVVAGAGVPVAKHGNRAASSRAGSADVLEALGVNLDASPEVIEDAVNTLGVGFMFARNYHPALRHAAPVRSDLAARTVFNILGPLSNPAGATHLVVGVFKPELTRTLAEVLRLLGAKGATIVYGDGLDEFTVCGVNTVSGLRGGEIIDRTLHPEEVGLALHPRESLVGGTPAENAEITRALLTGGGTEAQRDIVALNSGAALRTAGRVDSIREGVAQAREVMNAGLGWDVLQRYAALTR
ncbi:anthranilate phosphoribosyltransferase [Deinococcus radiopugnans]|uniref:Anthranilate phosphoribosyltransferase n=2 Tax=Deinococcus radiopugnans TaxID=57497 RepID=A0A0A7KG57_9DEIO|nr:anthranilate phosphoribosyltransferase [Deinococcus radiopugnans]AIZ44194.1 anthranilate phosphoribosyltransferase [Deinococcus radiopugnans]MBB6015578.1 anthranilate phosphoribosyltransferase [Deinococcus radiopugnans ATCC 19172]TNM72715.1 anthranilate phosphoribosyltransferase [Deinococcus radiopugnans ATCC 19172]